MVINKSYIAIVCSLFIVCNAFGQIPNIEEYQKKYVDDNAVYLNRQENHVIKLKKGELKIYLDVYDEMLMLNSKANLYGEKSISYSSFSEIDKIDAKTILPPAKGNKIIKVDNIITRNDLGGSSFYDDIKVKKFLFPAIEPGSRTVVSYREIIKEPRFLGSFYFNAYLPVEQASYSLTFPKKVKINFKLFHDKENQVVFTKTENRKTITYTWTAKNMKKIKTEDNSPSLSYYTPHLLVYIEEYDKKGKPEKVLSSVDDLYNWYYSLVKPINTVKGDALKYIVDSLTKDVPLEMDKVKNIFYWVQDNIKYVAFEDGLGGFVPREANDICDKRYGDCKDMASIITEMLKAANITSYLTWIGTRDIPYSYKETPVPSCDNHMIATYINNGTYYFLDGTGKHAPFGMHTSMIQGKEALIGKAEKQYEIAVVPVIEKEKNLFVDSTTIDISNGKITGSGKIIATGYEKTGFTYRMINATDDEKKKYLNSVLEKGSNKFQIDTLKYKNLNDHDKELTIDYTYNVADYLKQNGNELYINLNLDKEYQRDVIDIAERTTDREFQFKSLHQFTTMLTIPTGYMVEYLPLDANFTNDLFGFNMKYKVKGDKIYLDKTITINLLMLSQKDFGQWNKMITSLNKAYNESIILKKK